MAFSQESIDRWKKGGQFSPEDMQMFSEQVGGDTAGMEYWGDDALQEYAKYLNDEMTKGSKTEVELLTERVNALEQKLNYVVTLLLGIRDASMGGQ